MACSVPGVPVASSAAPVPPMARSGRYSSAALVLAGDPPGPAVTPHWPGVRQISAARATVPITGWLWIGRASVGRVPDALTVQGLAAVRATVSTGPSGPARGAVVGVVS